MGAPTPGYHVIALPPRRMLPKAFFLGIFLSYKWKPPVMDFTLRIFGQNCAHLKTMLEEEEGPCFFSVIKASLLPSRRMERTVCWVNFKWHLPYLLHMLPSLPTFSSHALSVPLCLWTLFSSRGHDPQYTGSSKGLSRNPIQHFFFWFYLHILSPPIQHKALKNKDCLMLIFLSSTQHRSCLMVSV